MKTHYPLKLNNEFYVTKSGVEKLFAKKKVYAIGYGSLLFANGWARRGMDVVTQPKDLIECNVHGYKRGPYGIQSGHHFYGAIPDAKSQFNAVLNPIHSFNDWVGLMQTEYIAGMFQNYNYRVVDVTDALSDVTLPKNAAVHMVANEPGNLFAYHKAKPAPHYYKYVWRGLGDRTEEFQREFLKTGGLTKFVDTKRRRTYEWPMK
jgi:hypothetical protein